MNEPMITELYNGIGIIYDDELIEKEQNSEVTQIVNQIDGYGIPILERYEIPEDPSEAVKHLRNVSFIILDWEFRKIDIEAKLSGVKLGEDLGAYYQKRLLDFIDGLLKNTFCPIFIFSKDDPSSIEKILSDEKIITPGCCTRIFIKRKSDLLDGKLFESIGSWLKTNLSIYVMKKWESEHTKSRIALFNSFEQIHPAWPKALWETFKADGVSPSEELSALLFRNLQSALSPFSFCDDLFEKTQTKSLSQDDIRKVMSGERMLQKSVLNDNMVAPGDLFLDDRELYVNIRPACDCIVRDGATNVTLYLLKGTKLSTSCETKSYDETYGHIKELDCQSIVFALHNGKSYDFRFKELKQISWNEWNTKRIGRLLPPYITRIQQRYAAYIQREGLPRIPRAAISTSNVEPSKISMSGGC